ncbi:hypothetical protein C466_00175 [Halorubrum distributum JCM 10118]|uniref:Uracil-DNA glycosylase-like domain-containing protein n=2 Tax=Halorubrum distributum TaxID=29283 RepID=M0FG99_9EURY|nr:hypothetical protein C466_00175 [Halorubrum distributum JCM 10118]
MLSICFLNLFVMISDKLQQADVDPEKDYQLRALDPDLVITFGGNAWPALRRSTTPEPVMETDADPESIMAIHGILHRISEPVNTHVLPLAHMSGQVWWRFPPEEYISRLSKALEVLERQ